MDSDAFLKEKCGQGSDGSGAWKTYSIAVLGDSGGLGKIDSRYERQTH